MVVLHHLMLSNFLIQNAQRSRILMADTICNNCEYFEGNVGGYGNCGVYNVTVYQQDKEGCRYFKQKYGNVKDVKNSLKLRVVGIANDRDAKELPYGTLVVKGYSAYLVGKNNELIPVLTEDDPEKREDKSMSKDFLEEHFVKGAKECSSPEDILNWYRNLYYKEEQNTERRIVAEAINDYFMKVKDRNHQIAQATRLDTVLD
jgi:hypothetical protein